MPSDAYKRGGKFRKAQDAHIVCIDDRGKVVQRTCSLPIAKTVMEMWVGGASVNRLRFIQLYCAGDLAACSEWHASEIAGEWVEGRAFCDD